jgi:hypothetical protein
MKKTSLLFIMLSLLGLSVACNNERNDEIEREEVTEEIGHEMDELGDKMENAKDELAD